MTGAVSAGRRRVDILAIERARLSPEAIMAGNAIRDVLERVQSAGGARWAERVDTSINPGAVADHAQVVAHQAHVTMKKVVDTVGPVDARLLRRVLGDGLTFDQVAAAEGRTGDRAVAYFAQRIRDSLEELGRRYIASGRAHRRPVDNFLDQAQRRGIA